MRQYFITGINGFVGINLVNELLKEDSNYIVGFILPNEKVNELLLNERIKLIKGNILNKEDVYHFLNDDTKSDKYIIHLAGRISTLKNNDPLTYDINFNGTKNIVDTANKINNFKRLIFISSVDALSRKEIGIITEQDYYDHNQVEGVYSKSKADSNNYVIDNSNIPYIIIMPSAIYGPNDINVNAPINKAIVKFLHNKLPAITKGGYDLVDVRDVINGIIASIDTDNINTSYILSGEYLSVKNLFDLVAELSNKKRVKFTVPHFLIKFISPLIEYSARRKNKIPLFTSFSMDCLKQNANYSYKKASDYLSYHPRNSRETIADIIEYFSTLKK